MKTAAQKGNASFLINLLEAINPARPSTDRINLVLMLSQSKNPIISAQDERLVTDVANKQLASLKEKCGAPGTTYMRDGKSFTGIQDEKAYAAATDPEAALLRFDSAKARLIYLRAEPHDASEISNYNRALVAVSAGKLSSSQIILLLRRGLTERLTPEYKTQLLETIFLNSPQKVRDQLQTMGNFSHLPASPVDSTDPAVNRPDKNF